MAVAKPVFIEPPSLRLRSWWTTRDVAVGGGQLVGDLGRAVGRCVVDDDQLVVGDLARSASILAHALADSDGALDVVLLVPHREEDRQHSGHGRVGSRREGSRVTWADGRRAALVRHARAPAGTVAGMSRRPRRRRPPPTVAPADATSRRVRRAASRASSRRRLAGRRPVATWVLVIVGVRRRCGRPAVSSASAPGGSGRDGEPQLGRASTMLPFVAAARVMRAGASTTSATCRGSARWRRRDRASSGLVDLVASSASRCARAGDRRRRPRWSRSASLAGMYRDDRVRGRAAAGRRPATPS